MLNVEPRLGTFHLPISNAELSSAGNAGGRPATKLSTGPVGAALASAAAKGAAQLSIRPFLYGVSWDLRDPDIPEFAWSLLFLSNEY